MIREQFERTLHVLGLKSFRAIENFLFVGFSAALKKIKCRKCQNVK